LALSDTGASRLSWRPRHLATGADAIGLGHALSSANGAPGATLSLQVFLKTELEMEMHRTSFLLTIAALAGFATAVHADDGARPRGQMMLAKLEGKGYPGDACHAAYRGKEIQQGIYEFEDNELVCRAPGGEKIPCHVYDDLGPPAESLCVDGWKY